MKFEEICCSLELSKRLKELGVKQESLFYWLHCPISHPWRLVTKNSNDNSILPDYLSDGNAYSAFTAAELGEMLPSSINEWGLCFDVSSCATINGIKNFWKCTYADYDKKLFNEVSDLSLSNCMAKTLIHLVENNLVADEVKKLMRSYSTAKKKLKKPKGELNNEI